MNDGVEDRDDQLRIIDAEIADHPATAARDRIDLVTRSLTAGFEPNFAELVKLLMAAGEDENLAVELFQNVRPPVVRQKFELLLTNRLLNYLAANGALIDHTRIATNSLDSDGTVMHEFEDRKKSVVAMESVGFIKDLRNFVLHRNLPFLGHTIAFGPGADGGGVAMTASTIELSTSQLLDWGKWSSGSRDFLKSVGGEKLALLPLIEAHGAAMSQLHRWLINALEEEMSVFIAEMNDLITRREAIRFGVTVQEAEAMIRERSLREYGREIEPDGTDAETDIGRSEAPESGA